MSNCQFDSFNLFSSYDVEDTRFIRYFLLQVSVYMVPLAPSQPFHWCFLFVFLLYQLTPYLQTAAVYINLVQKFTTFGIIISQ